MGTVKYANIVYGAVTGRQNIPVGDGRVRVAAHPPVQNLVLTSAARATGR